MKLGGANVFLALDRGRVEGGEVRAGFRGPRLVSYAAEPLPGAALEPLPFERNVRQPEVVREAVQKVAAALRGWRRSVVLVLPDGIARTSLLDPPASVAVDHFARFRLAQGLPFAAAEAVVGSLKVGAGTYAAAALWRKVVAEYEEAVSGAGLEIQSAALGPFLALAGLGSGRARERLTIDVLLGGAAYSIAATDGKGLRALRTRRLPSSEGSQEIAAEVQRTAAASGGGPFDVRVVGHGAAPVLTELRRRNVPAEAGWTLAHDGLRIEPSELVWCGAAA